MSLTVAYLACAVAFAVFVDVTTVHDGYWADRLTKLAAALSWPAWAVLVAVVVLRASRSRSGSSPETERKG